MKPRLKKRQEKTRSDVWKRSLQVDLKLLKMMPACHGNRLKITAFPPEGILLQSILKLNKTRSTTWFRA